MSLVELEALGHQHKSPLQALREHCLDCCAGSAHEVRLCVSVGCPAWPFRLGRNPYRAPPSDAQREARRRSAARLRSPAADAVSGTGPDATSTGDDVGQRIAPSDASWS
jgi:hypothetical protein